MLRSGRSVPASSARVPAPDPPGNWRGRSLYLRTVTGEVAYILESPMAPHAPVLIRPAGLRLVAVAGLLACSGCRSETNIVTKQPTEEEETVEVVQFTNDWGQWLSLDVLPDGRPVAAFYDNTEGAVGFAIATIDADGSVTWAYEEPDGYPDSGGLDPGDRGKYVDMVIAPNGDVWLAYQDIQNENLRFARRYFLSGLWENGVADGGSGPETASGYFASIALDGSGNPVAAHHDQGTGELRVAHWQGTAFSGSVLDAGTAPEVEEGADPIVADVGEFPSLEIVNGVEYIAYYDKANGDLKMARGSAGAYTTEVVYDEGDVGAWVDLAIDNGTMHLAFHDVGNQNLLYASGEPGGFRIEVVDDDKYVGADTDVLMVQGSPRIAYFDGHNNDMKVATRVGDGWDLASVAGDTTAMGFFNELIEVGGQVYAGCYDYTDRTVWFSVLN